MIRLKDILSESANFNPKDFGKVNTTYEWLEDALMKKKLANLNNEKKVKKELKILKNAMNIAWRYSSIIDGNIKPEDFFK